MKTLSFPLYHGTSTLFEDKIKTYGLGGFNPIKEYRIIELLKQLKSIADDNQIYTVAIDDIVNQDKGYLQHGQVYLTPSPRIAGLYAYNIKGNKHGSECFTELFNLVEELNKKEIKIPNSINNEYSEVLVTLKEQRKEKRVYQLNNLTTDYLLCSENGNINIESMLGTIEELILKYGNGTSAFYDKIGSSGLNFRLALPIPWDNLIEI
jgi:hypothetical protein